MMNRFLILAFLILLISCIQSKKEIAGNYVLQNSNEEFVAEILELKIDSTFVFSGLENIDGDPMTWVIEGVWKLEGDTIWLNSIEQDKKEYGKNFNSNYLKSFLDSIRYLDQALILCHNCSFVVKDGFLSYIKNGEELLYVKGKQSIYK